MFILEAAPTVICGLIVVFYLTDYPRLAKWLSQEQRDWLQAACRRAGGAGIFPAAWQRPGRH